MTLERPALKRRAREIMALSNPKILSVGLLYVLLTAVVSYLGARVLGVNMSQSEIQHYLNFVAEGNYELAVRYAEQMIPPAGAYAIHALLSLAMRVVGAGFLIFVLNSVRRSAPCRANLLDGFGFWWKILAVELLRDLLVGLGTLLLVVPGVVAHYRYSQASFLLIDDPTRSPIQCLRESAMLMAGRKLELLSLDLSLVGWYLLGSTGMLGFMAYAFRVWTVPYTATVKALFFESLLGRDIFRDPEISAEV